MHILGIQMEHIYGLMQERRNSIANALELHLSCIKAADDDAGNLQPVFLKRLYLLHICIFSFFLFNTSLITI